MSEPMTAAQLVELVTSRPGYTSSVGTRVLFAEPGRVHLALDRRSDLLQFSGFPHGGVIAGLADHAADGWGGHDRAAQRTHRSYGRSPH